MAGPALVIVAGIATAIIAFSGADGLVADDYYKRGLGINRELKRSATAASLGLSAQLSYETATGRLRVVLHGGPGAAGEEPVLHLAHPTRAREDRRVPLELGANGVYIASIGLPSSARWRVVIETAQWRLEGDWRDPARPIELHPPG